MSEVGSLALPQVVLRVDDVIQLEALLDLSKRLDLCIEGDVNEMAAIDVIRLISEGLAAKLLDLFESSSLGFHFFGDKADKLVDLGFLTFGIKDNQSFVFPAHLVVKFRELRGRCSD